MAKRILIADDSVTIQRAFAMVFTAQDFSLVAARSYDEALTAAKKERPDLVIADVGLGNRTGYDLCAAFKADVGFRGIPVYILASSQVAFDEAKARQVGADGSFNKPFDSQQLLDKVNDALAKGAAPAPVPVAAAAAVPVSAPVGRPMAAAPGPAPSAVPQPTPARADATGPVEDVDFDDEDSYGEFTIERTSPSAAPAARAAVPAAAARPSTAMPAVSAPPPRPSYIPGVSPAATSRPSAPAAAKTPPPLPRPPAGQPIAAIPLDGAAGRQTLSRTIMGMPAVGSSGGSAPVQAKAPAPASAPGPVPAAAAPAPAAPSSATTAPARPSIIPAAASVVETRAPEPKVEARPEAKLEAKIESKIDQKVAAIAARGPEYEAIAKLSREVIEQIVWEVVPELAEVIVREHVERLAAGKK